jgi:hypothetical protein
MRARLECETSSIQLSRGFVWTVKASLLREERDYDLDTS